MKDQDRPAGGGRHAASAARRRRAPLLLAVATAVGVWLGVSAPEVSPVAAPAPATPARPADVTPTTPQPGLVIPVDPRPQRGRGR